VATARTSPPSHPPPKVSVYNGHRNSIPGKGNDYYSIRMKSPSPMPYISSNSGDNGISGSLSASGSAGDLPSMANGSRAIATPKQRGISGSNELRTAAKELFPTIITPRDDAVEVKNDNAVLEVTPPRIKKKKAIGGDNPMLMLNTSPSSPPQKGMQSPSHLKLQTNPMLVQEPSPPQGGKPGLSPSTPSGRQSQPFSASTAESHAAPVSGPASTLIPVGYTLPPPSPAVRAQNRRMFGDNYSEPVGISNAITPRNRTPARDESPTVTVPKTPKSGPGSANTPMSARDGSANRSRTPRAASNSKQTPSFFIPEVVSTHERPSHDVSPLTSSPSSPSMVSPANQGQWSARSFGSSQRPQAASSSLPLPPPRQPSPGTNRAKPGPVSARGSESSTAYEGAPSLKSLGAAATTAIVNSKTASTTIIQSALTSPRPVSANMALPVPGSNFSSQQIPGKSGTTVGSEPAPAEAGGVQSKVMTVIKIVLHGKSPTYICGHTHLNTTVPFFSKGHLFCSKQCYLAAKASDNGSLQMSSGASVGSTNTFSNMFAGLKDAGTVGSHGDPSVRPYQSPSPGQRASAIPKSTRRRSQSPAVADPAAARSPGTGPPSVAGSAHNSPDAGIAERGRKPTRASVDRARASKDVDREVVEYTNVRSTRSRSLSAEAARSKREPPQSSSHGLVRRSAASPSPLGMGSARGQRDTAVPPRPTRSTSAGPDRRQINKSPAPASRASPSRGLSSAHSGSTASTNRRASSASRVPVNVDADSLNSIISDLTTDSKRQQLKAQMAKTGRVKGRSSGYGQFAPGTVGVNSPGVPKRSSSRGRVSAGIAAQPGSALLPTPPVAAAPPANQQRSQSAPPKLLRFKPDLHIDTSAPPEPVTPARKPPIPKTPTRLTATPSKLSMDAGLVFAPSVRKAPTPSFRKAMSEMGSVGNADGESAASVASANQTEATPPPPAAVSRLIRSIKGTTTQPASAPPAHRKLGNQPSGAGTFSPDRADIAEKASAKTGKSAGGARAQKKATAKDTAAKDGANLNSSTGSNVDDADEDAAKFGTASIEPTELGSYANSKTTGPAAGTKTSLRAEHFFRAPTISTLGSPVKEARSLPESVEANAERSDELRSPDVNQRQVFEPLFTAAPTTADPLSVDTEGTPVSGGKSTQSGQDNYNSQFLETTETIVDDIPHASPPIKSPFCHTGVSGLMTGNVAGLFLGFYISSPPHTTGSKPPINPPNTHHPTSEHWKQQKVQPGHHQAAEHCPGHRFG
jgi:hypothetical protein